VVFPFRSRVRLHVPLADVPGAHRTLPQEGPRDHEALDLGCPLVDRAHPERPENGAPRGNRSRTRYPPSTWTALSARPVPGLRREDFRHRRLREYGAPRSLRDAARYTSNCAASSSVAESRSIHWNRLEIPPGAGRTCFRSFAYSVAVPRADRAIPIAWAAMPIRPPSSVPQRDLQVPLRGPEQGRLSGCGTRRMRGTRCRTPSAPSCARASRPKTRGCPARRGRR